MKLLKSYNFVDKDPVVDKMRGPVNRSQMSYSQISEKSGVAASTLYNWFEGNTKRPQYATVVAVMRVLGYKEMFVKKGVKLEAGTAAASSATKGLVRRAQGGS
jgi:DNA-binding phage protein